MSAESIQVWVPRRWRRLLATGPSLSRMRHILHQVTRLRQRTLIARCSVSHVCASCDIVPICVVMEPELLTSPEVSNLLGVSIRTVHRRVDAGDLRAVRKLPGPNGAFLFDRAEVERFLENQRTADGGDANRASAAAS